MEVGDPEGAQVGEHVPRAAERMALLAHGVGGQPGLERGLGGVGVDLVVNIDAEIADHPDAGTGDGGEEGAEAGGFHVVTGSGRQTGFN